MSKSIREHNFFTREPETVAEELLGKFICRRFEYGKVLRWCITETEAYDSIEKVTYKNEMFQNVGKWCLYYDMLMISCKTEEGYDNVLIRSLDCIKGPCNIVETLEIKALKDELIGKDVLCCEKLWLEDWGVTIEPYDPQSRVGLSQKDNNQDEIAAKKNYQAKAICFPCFNSENELKYK